VSRDSLRFPPLRMATALCLAWLGSCSSTAPHVERRMLLPAASVACVQGTLTADLGWTRRDRRRDGTLAPRKWTYLDVPSADGPVEVMARWDGRGTTLFLDVLLLDAAPTWPKKLDQARQALRFVHGRLAAVCPDVPPWQETAEWMVDPFPPAHRYGSLGSSGLIVGCAAAFVGLLAWLVWFVSHRAARSLARGNDPRVPRR
jgi:hypothetical protein